MLLGHLVNIKGISEQTEGAKGKEYAQKSLLTITAEKWALELKKRRRMNDGREF